MSLYGYMGFSGINGAPRDVTPDAVNWANISAAHGGAAQTNADQTITGISKAISLTPTFGVVTGMTDATWEMFVNGVSQFTNGLVLQPGSVSVSAGDTVHFRLNPGPVSAGNTTITVTNSSDGSGVTLDTFTLTVT